MWVYFLIVDLIMLISLLTTFIAAESVTLDEDQYGREYVLAARIAVWVWVYFSLLIWGVFIIVYVGVPWALEWPSQP
jgi:hypothetical protein